MRSVNLRDFVKSNHYFVKNIVLLREKENFSWCYCLSIVKKCIVHRKKKMRQTGILLKDLVAWFSSKVNDNWIDFREENFSSCQSVATV